MRALISLLLVFRAGPLPAETLPRLAKPLLVQAPTGSSCIAYPCSASINIAADLYGQQDTRPDTWGFADAVATPIKFLGVPSGYGVHLLHIRGDFIAFAHGAVLPGTNAGVNWGITTTQPTFSNTVQFAASGCIAWVQGSVNAVNLRAPFDQDVSVGGWLGSDNAMVSTEASWLNDTGLSIHSEATILIDYQFVRSATSGV